MMVMCEQVSCVASAGAADCVLACRSDLAHSPFFTLDSKTKSLHTSLGRRTPAYSPCHEIVWSLFLPFFPFFFSFLSGQPL